MLESLYFDTELMDAKPIFANKPEWGLPYLKYLVYHCEYPEKGILKYIYIIITLEKFIN